MWYVIILLFVVATAFCAVMLIRNEKTYRYRIRLLDEIHRASIRDIDLGRKWAWRYDYLNSVSYKEMANKFWKPLDSFYKDKSFIEL